jgi:glycosyltransferase involved in cell wall biosynthesis
MKISCIIPAYNEEKTVFGVVEAVKGSGLFDEIIVISDGSTDMTPYILKRVNGIDFIDLERNIGKGGAVWHGLQRATGEIIVMLDADLIGVSKEHLEKIINPLKDEGIHNCIGIIQHKSRWWMSLSQFFLSDLSGQQAFFKYLVEGVDIKDKRFGVEIALKHHFKKKNARVKKVFLRGVSHLMKEQKMGFEEGIKHRSKMYREVGREMGNNLKQKIVDATKDFGE